MEDIEHHRSGFMCGQLAVDFANIFKAFVGSNYLAVSFFFAQSGLLLGIVGILVISTLEGHCCSLIVQCKTLAIHKMLQSREDWLNSTIEAVENPSRLKLRKKVERRLTYSDVAWVAAGKWGSRLVTFMLFFTQFGFGIGYLIFLGNTLRKFLPTISNTISFTALTLSPALNLTTTMSPATAMHTTMVLNSTTFLPTDQTSLVTTTLNLSTIFGTTSVLENSFSTDNISTTPAIPAFNITGNSSSFNPSSSYATYQYYIIVAIFVPFFAAFALVRNIRHLGAGSILANFSILVGYIAIMSYILIDFEVSDNVDYWANWSTFPIFIGGITSSYEGIGVVIPIESSMVHTRRWFHHLLFAVFVLATLVLSSMGILGYLRFGDHTEQTIVWNMSTNTALPMVVYAVVSIGVIFTFPLQAFPVIEICEDFLFAEGSIFGPAKKDEGDIQRETSPLLDSQEEADPDMLKVLQQVPVAVSISNEVATWKRNLLRIIIIILEGSLALALKDDYAYFGAFIGAIGSTTLGFIMPCFLHLKLGQRLHPVKQIKDIGIIAFGIVGGILAVYTSVAQIIDNYV